MNILDLAHEMEVHAKNEREEKQLQRCREVIAQMQAREKTILAKDKAQQRKARTRRLIQNGALAEQYLNCQDIEPEDFKRLLQLMTQLPDVLKFFAAITDGNRGE